MKVSLSFPDIPALDTRFAIDGQDYVLVGSEPYTRGYDGAASALLIWQANCADCGAPFQIKTPLGFTTGQSRRCVEHRSAGKPVNPKAANFYRMRRK